MIAIPQLRMAKLISFMDDAAKPGGFDLLVCVLPLQSAHEAAGAAGTRHSPRPPGARDSSTTRPLRAVRSRTSFLGQGRGMRSPDAAQRAALRGLVRC